MNDQNPIDAAIRLLETAVDPETEFYNRPVLAQRALSALRQSPPGMTFAQYQDCAATTATWAADQQPLLYTALGLVGEAGEVANKVKKVLRGDYDRDALREMLAGELGDVLWYLTMLARELDLDLSAIAQANLDKLASRQARGVIVGSGDER